MANVSLARVVVDTNVVFEGLTQRGDAAGFIVETWLAGWLPVCVSDPLAYEYADVLSRKLSEARWQRIEPALGSLLSLSSPVVIHFTWRPMSPDPGDDHVIDCAMNAGATVITSNIRDFRSARESLGLRIIRPVEAAIQLAGEVE